jgi:hypothetical protein
MVKRSKGSKSGAAQNSAKRKQGFLKATAHLIGSTIGGMAVRTGIVKLPSKNKQQDKPIARQTRENKPSRKASPRGARHKRGIRRLARKPARDGRGQARTK